MTNSKRKGSSYERDVARMLSKWATGTDEVLCFWRQAGSGSVSTIAKKNNKNASGLDGDFICVAEQDYPKFQILKQFLQTFFVDSKCLGGVHLMMTNPKNQKSNQLLNEIKKVFGEAKSSNKIPMLICKATNDKKIDDFIILPIETTFKRKNSMSYYINNFETFDIITCAEFFDLNGFDTFVSENK